MKRQRRIPTQTGPVARRWKSSSTGEILIGDHMLKACTRRRKILARSSAEAELYATALGASESKGMVSLLCDLGYEVKPVLAIDAKAIEHTLHKTRK